MFTPHFPSTQPIYMAKLHLRELVPASFVDQNESRVSIRTGDIGKESQSATPAQEPELEINFSEAGASSYGLIAHSNEIREMRKEPTLLRERFNLDLIRIRELL
ncbi:hypothetical protein EVAR_8252_1 [Eumeta japonica]|uniref:Uncharacterized protein n=1 Tax=Eumeta variegata TaxID=151549 RepID=A0A4C1TFT7_EUMVA|nr:hypothetical protein EVAR_8252_1 [Eumeta japonica]